MASCSVGGQRKVQFVVAFGFLSLVLLLPSWLFFYFFVPTGSATCVAEQKNRMNGTARRNTGQFSVCSVKNILQFAGGQCTAFLFLKLTHKRQQPLAGKDPIEFRLNKEGSVTTGGFLGTGTGIGVLVTVQVLISTQQVHEYTSTRVPTLNSTCTWVVGSWVPLQSCNAMEYGMPWNADFHPQFHVPWSSQSRQCRWEAGMVQFLLIPKSGYADMLSSSIKKQTVCRMQIHDWIRICTYR